MALIVRAASESQLAVRDLPNMGCAIGVPVYCIV